MLLMLFPLQLQIQEMKLDTRLQRTQTALRDLDTEHKQLKDASAAKIQELQGRVQELTRQCGDLEVGKGMQPCCNYL
jgi:hypothetical protein